MGLVTRTELAARIFEAPVRGSGRGGGVALYGRFQKCWVYPKGHGRLSLHRGIVDSCDTYFYTIGAKAGIDNLAFYGDLAGFGHLTGQARGAVTPDRRPSIRPVPPWARGGASPSSRIASSSVSGAHFDEEPEIRLDLRRPAGHRGADGCGSALDVFRDGRIAVEPVDVLSLDA